MHTHSSEHGTAEAGTLSIAPLASYARLHLKRSSRARVRLTAR
jgi:hypothetical protein